MRMLRVFMFAMLLVFVLVLARFAKRQFELMSLHISLMMNGLVVCTFLFKILMLKRMRFHFSLILMKVRFSGISLIFGQHLSSTLRFRFIFRLETVYTSYRINFSFKITF